MAKIILREREYSKRGEKSKKSIDYSDEHERSIVMRYDSVNSAKINIPKKGGTNFYFTSKTLSLLDVLNWVEINLGKIDEATFIIFSVNEIMAEYIVSLTKRTKVKIIISDLMNSQREKERLITRLLEKGCEDVVFCHNHAKVVTAKIGDNYITLTGSMNSGNNARIETLEIFNCEKMYNFIAKQYEYLKQHFRIKPRYFD